MTDGPLTPEVIAYGEYLASLPSDTDRAAAEKAKRQLVLANLPDEEVGKVPVQNLGSYLDNEITLPPMLVEPGLVARGAITAMVARGGKGKTTVSLNRLLRWAMGRPLFDELPDVLAPVSPLKSLIIENEGAPGHFQQTLRTILYYEGEDGAKYSAEEREAARENVHIWGDGGWSGLKLDDEANFDLVDRAIGETGVDIAFIEPFRGLWHGEENSSTEMGYVLDRMSKLASDHKCAIMVTHHENKSGGGDDPMSAFRGSTAMEGAAAVMEQWKPVKGGRQRELTWVKNRFKPAPADVRMEFEADSWSYHYVAESELGREIMTFLRQFPDSYFSWTDLSTELGESYAKVRKASGSLADEGKVKKRSFEGTIKIAYHQGAESDAQPDAVAIT